MPEYVNEKKIQLAVKEGYNRMARFRKARMAFIRQYVGQWYAGESVTVGDEPLNFIYHVIRSLVPNLITRNPTSRVTTEIREYATYAYLLGIGLDKLNNKINLKNIIRRAVVDSLFCMGIVKTGIAATDSLIEFGDVRVDPGQIFADNVDFDDFVADATCTTWEEAAFMGHRSRIPRQLLLDDDECDHDVVMRLPRSTSDAAKKKVSMLSQRGLSNQEMFELQDFVDIVELWIPGAGASIIIPDPDQYMSNGYIKIQDFYGPATGPYHILSLTQPVPGNPFPIAPVGIWYDLHIMANRLMKKQMERADAQKTLFVADPAAADQVDDMREAPDGEIIYGNPDNVTVVSTPGAERGTSDSLSNIQVWLNYLSGNTDQTAGISSASETATQATILEANANVGIEDSRGMIYDFTAGINSDFGWFMHYDPFLEIPLTVRDSERGERMPDGLVPGQSLRLTPQQRRGEHYH